MRVLVTGGRAFTSYHDAMWLYAGLSLLHSLEPITEVIEGGANGFDHHAYNWVLWRQACGDRIAHTQVRPDWERHGRSAGAIRNGEMAKMQPDVVLACPGGNGTAHMVQVAQAAKIRVVRLEKMPVVRGGPVIGSATALDQTHAAPAAP